MGVKREIDVPNTNERKKKSFQRGNLSVIALLCCVVLYYQREEKDIERVVQVK